MDTAEPGRASGDGADEVGDGGTDHEVTSHAVTAGARRAAGMIALVAGALMHLIVGAFVASSGLVAPAWAVALLVGVWAGLAVMLWRWHRRRPLAALGLPFVAAVVWWGTITLGENLLGWRG